MKTNITLLTLMITSRSSLILIHIYRNIIVLQYICISSEDPCAKVKLLVTIKMNILSNLDL